jgi:hypothetical protein
MTRKPPGAESPVPAPEKIEESRAHCARPDQAVGIFSIRLGVFHPTRDISNPTRGVQNITRGVPNPMYALRGIVHGRFNVECGRWPPAFGVSASARRPKRRKRRAKVLVRAPSDPVFEANLVAHGVQNTTRGVQNTTRDVFYPKHGVFYPMERSRLPNCGRRGLTRRPRDAEREPARAASGHPVAFEGTGRLQ